MPRDSELHKLFLEIENEISLKKPAIIDEKLLSQCNKVILQFDEQTINAFNKLLFKYTDDYEGLTNNELLVLNLSSLETSFSYYNDNIIVNQYEFTLYNEAKKVVDELFSKTGKQVIDISFLSQILDSIVALENLTLSLSILCIRIMSILQMFGVYSDEPQSHTYWIDKKTYYEFVNRYEKLEIKE